jgi:Tol biopolymer transport system component
MSSSEIPAAPVRLTTDGRFKRDPVFWPGGNELIYAALMPVATMAAQTEGLEGRVRLMRMRWADRSVTPFHPRLDNQRLSDRELCVSADGSIYAYCQVRASEKIVIVVEDLVRQRTATIESNANPAASFVNGPTLAPDGNRIVYMKDSNRLLARELWQEGARDVELGVEGDLRPRFSPDGRQIVFASRRDRDYEVYAMNADGSEARRLTRSRGIDTNAVFSPDGRRIAFTSNRDGNYEIYVMDADGGNVRRVTRNAERDDFPCWHPDGNHLVFVGERAGRFDLYMVDAPPIV